MSVCEFFMENVTADEIKGKSVLEVGSRYVNGSVRPFINCLAPSEYVGADIESGKYVDVILPAEGLVEYFGEERFDVLIASEFLEHVRDWRRVVNNMKSVLKREGLLFITTRSRGFPFHAYPYDYWRFELADMRAIFSDFEIKSLRVDLMAPGVFFKGVKSATATLVDLATIEPYSMLICRRTMSIPELSDMSFSVKIRVSARAFVVKMGQKVLKTFDSTWNPEDAENASDCSHLP